VTPLAATGLLMAGFGVVIVQQEVALVV